MKEEPLLINTIDDAVKYRDELSNEVKTFLEWKRYAEVNDAKLRTIGICERFCERLSIRKNNTLQLLADLIKCQH